MKFRAQIKFILYASFGLLFLSGLAYFVVGRFPAHGEYGDIPQSTQSWTLRIHSVVSLWFMIFFGYLWARHVEPGLRQKRRRASGFALLIPFVAMFLSVPFLFYLVDEDWKRIAAGVHTYLGLAMLVPFIAHGILRTKAAAGQRGIESSVAE